MSEVSDKYGMKREDLELDLRENFVPNFPNTIK